MVKLRLPPKGYLGEGGNKVWPVHEVEVLRRLVGDTVDGYNVVVCCLQIKVSKVICIDLTWGCTLSSSSVEADRESRVTRMANCFLVPLSRKECASTMAPETLFQH